MEHVGIIIDRLLKQQDMNQRELAEKSGLGAGHISLIVGGKCAISIPSAVAISRALGIITAKEILNLQTEYQLEQYDLHAHQRQFEVLG